MTPEAMANLLRALPRVTPVTARLERRFWPRTSRAWYRDQREHWIGWLAHHAQRGTTTAVRVYDYIQSPPMLLWLAEAVGVDPVTVENAGREALRFSPRRKLECEAIRRIIPWGLIHHHLIKPKETSRAPDDQK